MAELPAFEVVLRSPQGEVRCWLDQPTGAPDASDEPARVRTALRIDYGDDGDRVRQDQAALRLVAELTRAVRGLSGIGPAEAVAAPGPSIGPWLVERIETDPVSRTLTRYLFQDYLAWCDRRGFQPVAQSDFGRELDQRGFRTAGSIRQGGFQGRARGGLRLRPEAVPMASDHATGSEAGR